MDRETLFCEGRAGPPGPGARHHRLATGARPARQGARVPGEPGARRNTNVSRRAAVVLDVRAALRAGADRRKRPDPRPPHARTDGRRPSLVRATEFPESDEPSP